MVWSQKGSNGKTYYLRRVGSGVFVTTESTHALSEVPDGWEVKEVGGRLKAVPKR